MYTSSSLKAFFICSCAALFYIYQFVLRVAPSVMVEDIMLSFHLDAASFSFLSASALYAYSLMQIPAGIFADRYGVRSCILLSVFFCSLGALCFSLTDNYWLAFLSRILMGMGSACAFLCLSKVAISWFGRQRQARIFGFTMTAGTIGALNGGAPLVYLLEFISWQGVFISLGLLGFIIWLLNYFFLKEKTQTESTQNTVAIDFNSALKTILTTPACWLNAIAALGIYACVSVIADLWGVAFCMQAFHFSRTQAAQLTSLIYVGLCVGSIIIPFLSDSLLARKKLILLGLCIIICSLIIFTFGAPTSLTSIACLLLIIGFFAGTEMLCFTNACEAATPAMAGTVTGFVNCVVMLGGSILQNLVGIVMNYSWQGGLTTHGEKIYTLREYQNGFTLIILCILFSFLVSTLINSPKNHVIATSK